MISTEAETLAETSTSVSNENKQTTIDSTANKEDIVSQTVSTELSQEDEEAILSEQNDNLTKLFGNINYGIILAFFDKFAVHLNLKEIALFKNLESSLTNQRTLNRKLLDFHINLLKNLHYGKNVKKDKWEHYLVRYMSKYSPKDSSQLEKNGYLSLDINSKVLIVKNLLESQFDENVKFKQILIEKITDLNSIRSTPLGRDKDGVSYWYFMDNECTIRLYTQNSNDKDYKTWKLTVKELSELKDLIQKLNDEPALVKLRSSKRYLKNIEKEKKLKEKQLKEEEEEALKLEMINKKEDKESDEEEVDKQEEEEDKLEEIKKDEDSNELTKSESSPSIKSEEDETKVDEESKDSITKVEEDSKDSITKIEEESVDVVTDSTDDIKPEQLNENETIKKEIETKKELKNEEELPKTPTKTSQTEESFLFEDDFIEPIALRRPTRASARKANEIQQLQLKTPTKTPKKQTPAKKNPEEDDLNEEEDEESSRKSKRKKNVKEDDEFKPKISKSPTKSNKKRNKKKTESESEESEEEEEEDPNFDSSCLKCSKVKKNQTLILCDGCDAAYHLICLKMDEIPEGDWFCSLCEHDKLIRQLETKQQLIETYLKELELAKTKSISKRTNRIADIGANLDNLFKNGKKRSRNSDENNDPYDDEDKTVAKRQRRQPFEDNNHKPAANFFANIEPVGPRTCRSKPRISYTFEEYDRTIQEAMGEKTAPIIDRSNLRSSKRNKPKKEKQYEDDDTESESDENSDAESVEFKPKSKKLDDEDDDDDEKKFSDDDEDFRPSKKKKSEPKNKKRSKTKRTKSRRSYVDDDEDDDVVDEEAITSEEDFSDLEAAGYYERRSTRNRKCFKESYCELEDDEEYQVKSKKRSKRKSDTDDEEEAFSESDEDDKPTKMLTSSRRSNRTKTTNKKYNDYDVDDEASDYKSDVDDDEKSLNNNHRSSESKPKSRIKKPWSSDDEEQEKSDNEQSSDDEKINKKKSIIKTPWSKEEDATEDEGKHEVEKEAAKPEEDQNKVETKPDEVKETNKSELIYSSSSSYSSSQSSTRSNSPVHKKTNGKEKLNSESLIDKLNKTTNLTQDDPVKKVEDIKPDDQEKISSKTDSTPHSDITPIKSPTKVKQTEPVTVNNTSSLIELSVKAVNIPVQIPIVNTTPQFTNLSNKPVNQLPTAPVPFQLYSPAELSQKPQLINQPVNNYPAGYANNNYPSSYPQLYYYYYQQQQQQLNPPQGQQIIMPNNMPQQIQNPLLTVPQQQPLTFLQPYSNSIVYNGQAPSNIPHSFVNTPGYTVQPSLFQPHLVNFSGGVQNVSVNSSVIGTNGVTLTPLSQPSHQPQLQLF